MLSSFELSLAIIAVVVAQVFIYVILRMLRGSKKPKGLISEETNLYSETERKTGNPIWWGIAIIGRFINILIGLLLIGYAFTNSWEVSELYKQAIQLPIWINYIGILLLWFCGLLMGSIRSYNINLTPFCLPMKKGYSLATGGPYKFVRHPLYVFYFLTTISLFMMTGIELLIISFLCHLSFIPQAYSEETALEKMFGKDWDDYTLKTGMFIPKLFKFQRAIIKE